MFSGSDNHDCTKWFISLTATATQCGSCFAEWMSFSWADFNFFNAQHSMIMTTAPLWLFHPLQTKFIFRPSFFAQYFSYKLILPRNHADLMDFKCFISCWEGNSGKKLHQILFVNSYKVYFWHPGERRSKCIKHGGAYLPISDGSLIQFPSGYSLFGAMCWIFSLAFCSPPNHGVNKFPSDPGKLGLEKPGNSVSRRIHLSNPQALLFTPALEKHVWHNAPKGKMPS